ncbi:MAG: CofH family radical SAM protein [Spirochaetota bacterium]|nr:CofH family radical SAM protein [Spirochaetota bacterium]OPZ35566.1 MAG: Aminodeoxyfutalosine synthase [Spirochaetes bacterium ADurb.BinA120]HPI14296.1 CofH family radical SAM protein [Spirochaetota bacterium]
MNAKNNLEGKILSGERIGRDDALALFSFDLPRLGLLADERRKKAHPSNEVGFIVDRIVNFTNVCTAACAFCAYHARAGSIEPYRMTIDEVLVKVDELAAAGGTQVMLQGGLDPQFGLEECSAMLRAIKERYPSIYLHSFSPAETVHLARRHGISISEVVAMLKEAGLDSMPGASDMLVDRVRRRVSPNKITKDEWVEVMRTLAAAGLKSSATMTYGLGETLEERVEHLEVVRGVQDETGILRAFIPWSFSPARTLMADMEPATGIDYLRLVAVARIYLDNIRFIQAGWLTEGHALAQIALSMGANDMGGVLTEEVVVKATGVETTADREGMIRVISAAGRVPVERDSDYRTIRSYG